MGEEIKKRERAHGRDLSKPWAYQNLPGAHAAHPVGTAAFLARLRLYNLI